MALKFVCQNCSREIVVEYLKRGDVAECKHCMSKNVVPEAAIETKEKPDYTRKGNSTSKQMKCPKCGLISPDIALRCDCGYYFDTGQIKEPYISKSETG